MRTTSAMPPFVLVALVFLAACEKSPEKKAEDQATANARLCAKIEALAGGISPRQKDECVGQITFMGPNVRACFEPCIDRAKDRIDYEVCKDECTSREGLVGTTCSSAYVFDEPNKTACVTALTSLEKTDKPKLTCIARCRREQPAPEAADCAKRCGAPTLPSRKDPTAAPVVAPPL